MSHLELVALMVREYDVAIRFFVDVLQFELVEDTPSLTNDGRQKQWVVIRSDGVQTGIQTRSPPPFRQDVCRARARAGASSKTVSSQ